MSKVFVNIGLSLDGYASLARALSKLHSARMRSGVPLNSIVRR